MMRQEAAAFDRRQVAVGLHQALEEKWNAGKRPVRSRRDAAGLGARLIEPAGDDGIEGRVQRLDARDGGVADLGGADLAAPHEIGETEGIMLVVVLGLHVQEPIDLPGVTRGNRSRPCVAVESAVVDLPNRARNDQSSVTA